MASSSIDSLLQITGPAREPVEGMRSPASPAKLFEELFSRAAQPTVPRNAAEPKSALRPADESPMPEQQGADNQASYPNDSHLHANSDDADQAKPAKVAESDESEPGQEPAENDVVEISASAVAQTASPPLSAEEPVEQTPESTSSADDKAVAEGESASSGESATDSANRPLENRENLPAATETAQPAAPELQAETSTDAQEQVAVSPRRASSQEVVADTTQNGAHESLVELATGETGSPKQAGLQPTDPAAADIRTTLARENEPTGHEPTGRGEDRDNSDKSQAKDRQTIQPSGMDKAAAAARTDDSKSAAAVRPTHTADSVPPTAIAPTTLDGVTSSGAADRVLDRLALARSVQPTRQAAESPALPAVDRTRFVGRVSSALRLAQQRDGQIQLRLSPPELGSLRLEIAVKQGVLTATLETETAAARHVLLENLPALRERLAAQEIRIERFDVDVRREGGEQSQNRAAQEHSGNPSRGRAGTPERQTDSRLPPADSIPPLITHLNKPSPDGLDVVI